MNKELNRRKIDKAMEMLAQNKADKTYLAICMLQEVYEEAPESFSKLEQLLLQGVLYEVVSEAQKHLGVEQEWAA